MEPGSNNNRLEIAMKELKTKLYALFNHVFATEKKSEESLAAGNTNVDKQAESCKETSGENETDDASFRKFLAGKKSSQLSSTTQTAKIDLYLNKVKIDYDNLKLDLLGWWKVNSLCFPILAKLVPQILITLIRVSFLNWRENSQRLQDSTYPHYIGGSCMWARLDLSRQRT
jgi:hypothetical protein